MKYTQFCKVVLSLLWTGTNIQNFKHVGFLGQTWFLLSTVGIQIQDIRIRDTLKKLDKSMSGNQTATAIPKPDEWSAAILFFTTSLDRFIMKNFLLMTLFYL
jgi:hypothetical protein